MKGKIIGYDFRDKSCGWGLDYMTKTKTKTKTNPSTLDPYYYHFLKGTTYRECCYRCNYCTKERVGDITIGDYWGIEKEHPEFYSTNGVSCILLNSKKGERLWSIVKDEFETLESTFEHSEIICVNDYSSDDSIEIIKEISQNLKSINVSILNMSFFLFLC